MTASTGDLERLLAQYRAAVARAVSSGGPLGPVLRVTIFDDSPAGSAGFDRIFTGLTATLDELPAALSAAVPAIRAAFARNFADERERTAWAALAPRTVAERTRLGFGGTGPILTRTGALRRHVMAAPPRVTRAGRTVELRVRPGRTVARTGAPYDALAQGTSRMPARPMVVVRQDDANRITSAISRELRRRAQANGLG